MSEPALVWFGDEQCRDVACAGGKGSSLAAMTAAGLPVPPGFVVPSWVLERSVDAAPPREAIAEAYARLGASHVAVRSSASAEDSDTASYAGQQETYLNVSGADDVCRRVVDCWTSFFTERALFYRA